MIKNLYSNYHGLKGKAGAESEEEHEQLLTEWKIRIIRDKLIEPEVVYGYFKCHNKGQKITS